MNLSRVEKIANAVLYEGYVLYPYRPSAVKNRQRFNFGVLYPREYCDLNPGSDNWQTRTECLVTGNAATRIEVKTRFLQMAARADWQEGIERAISAPGCELESLALHPFHWNVAFDDAAGGAGGRVERVEAGLELSASKFSEDLYKITLRVRNHSTLEEPSALTRDEALLRSLVSAHSILRVEGGRFISAIDPPERYQLGAGECRNEGTWPVLAGEAELDDMMLSAPIILYDYPQVAHESPGDLCDGLEIDEILALRILTLTDDEKREVRDGDERARCILERTELLPPEQFQKLHGVLRGMRTPSEETR